MVEVGEHAAFFFPASSGRAGPIEAAWYVGRVLRLSKPWWADVSFSDGKLWMRVKTEERGHTWFIVEERVVYSP